MATIGLIRHGITEWNIAGRAQGLADIPLNREGREIENLAAYLFTAVRYRIFSLYKKEKNTVAFAEPLEFIVVAASDPDSLFFEKEIRECIDVWLNMQPEKRKQVFEKNKLWKFFKILYAHAAVKFS